MGEQTDITISESVEQVDLTIDTNTESVSIETNETVENISLTVRDTGYVEAGQWINLAVGQNLAITPVLQTTTLPGKVYLYTYKSGATLYRYIADDRSEDAFYDSFSDPTLSVLVAERSIAL